MAKRTTIYRGIDNVPVYITDTSQLSPDVFNITELPTSLTSGKNLVKLKGNLTNLKSGTTLDIEVLDANRNPIFSEFIDYVDEDGSRVISIHVYDDTTPGDCSITILGCLQQANGQLIPVEFRDIPNVKWQTFIPVNPTADNVSDIIFVNEPEITISENVGVQLDRTYANGQFPAYEGPDGIVTYDLRNGVPYIQLTSTTGGNFTGDMVNGIITFSNITNAQPTPNFTPTSTEFRGRIKKFLNDTTAILYNPYIVQSNETLSTHTYNSFDTATFSLKFEADPSYIATQNSESFALLQVNNLEPDTGNISRIKVYSNSKGTVGTWELINDVLLDGTEIFVDSTASLTPDESIGLFKSQGDINTYWESDLYQGTTIGTDPALQSKSGSLMRGMLIRSTTNIAGDDEVLIARQKNAYSGFFVSESSYRLTFDAYGERTTLSDFKDLKISIYASGSAFNYNSTDLFNQALPVKLGKKIGEITSNASTSQKFYDQSIEFKSDKQGNGNLLFVVESGIWHIGNIETNTFAEIGYTPNYTRIRSEIPTKHKSGNQLSFKVEYFNKAGTKSKTVSYLFDNDFEGGNRYIDGSFSMLTGSLYVADTLESGIDISGLANTGYIRSLGYEGFNQATGSGNGGFILFSGSALPQQTATPYQGVGLEMVSDGSNYFRYRTNPSELDIRTKTFFLGDTSSIFISGSNGNLEISSSKFQLSPDGEITASAGLIGGTEILDSSLQSTTNLLSPDGAPSFELNSNGVISGSEAYIRRVANLTGAGAEVVPLLDTRIGLVDGRNIGRTVVSVSESISRNAASGFPNSNSSDFDNVAYHYFHLLPYENTIVLHYRQYTSCNGSLASNQSVVGATRFVFKTLENSGSMTSTSLTIPTNYDNWGGTIGTMQISTIRSQADGTNGLGITAEVGQGSESKTLTIPEASQARLIRVQVDQLLCENGPGTPASSVNHATELSNYGIIITRALGAAAIGDAAPEIPGSTS